MKCFPLLALVFTAPLMASSIPGSPYLATDSHAPRSLPVDGPVSVSWSDPADFTEIRRSNNRWESERGNWVVNLAAHMRQRSQRNLQPGQTLDIHITDIARAGNYEPWRGPWLNDVRIVRDIYPPRLNFTWRRLDANGQVIDQGERKLVDMAFMTGTPAFSTDPLRYEKRMVDRWVRDDLRTGHRGSGPR